jgi:glycosyltransferase involved in cell wall biosynthesis
MNLYRRLWQAGRTTSLERLILGRSGEAIRVSKEILPLLSVTKVIHWFEVYSPLANALSLLSHRFGISNFATIASLSRDFRYFDNILRASMAAFDRIVVTCRALGNYLQAIGIPRWKILHVPLGVDIDKFRPPSDKGQMKLRMGLQADDTIIAWFGPVSPCTYNDFRQLLDIAHLVQRHASPVFFCAFKYGLPSLSPPNVNVRFVSGITTLDYLSIADLVVLPFSPSKSIALPLTVAEALSAGVPVVATHMLGFDEAILNGVNGVLVKGISDIAPTIIRLCDDEDELARMSRNARDTAIQMFDAKRTVEAYRHLWSF